MLFRSDGDGDSAEKHREFYDEYLAVMDLTAEFYLKTVDTVFVHHALPRGLMQHHGRRVDLNDIKRPALMTIEGERDDITGVGQCAAAIGLCGAIPGARKVHYEQKRVGHYGIFNGSRFRAEIAPRIAQFVRQFDPARNASAATFAPVAGSADMTDGDGEHGAFSFPRSASFWSQVGDALRGVAPHLSHADVPDSSIDADREHAPRVTGAKSVNDR